MLSGLAHKYPFLRLLLPFVLGIVCGDQAFNEKLTVPFVSQLFVVGVGLMWGTYVLKRYSWRWLFGVVTFLTVLTAGFWITQSTLQQTQYPFSTEETPYRVHLLDAPQQKERSVMCLANIPTIDKQVLLYFSKDSLSSHLKRGDELLVCAKLAAPQNNGNFDEFDYARYLLHRGISATGFVGTGHFKVTTHQAAQALPWKERALEYRDQLLVYFRQLGFTGDEFGVLSALTVGYKDELSDAVSDQYSIAGVSHILALSGFHIVLLAGLISFVFSRLPFKRPGIQFVYSLVTLILLWGFAYFTGLSPSVVRSVAMFSVLSVAYLLDRKSITINTISATALLMLMVCPLWFFDVGFQLSFCAVLSIILFQPMIYRRLMRFRFSQKWVNGLLSTSLAAQIGTSPLVLFYFSRFSTHFLLSNLLVIPLVTLIMYGAVLMLFVSPFHVIAQFMAWVVNARITLLNAIVSWIGHLPYASIENSWMDLTELFVYYAILILLLWYANRPQLRKITVTLGLLSFVCCYHTAMYWQSKPQSSIVFYNVRGCPAVHCLADEEHSYLVCADSAARVSRLEKAASGYWKHSRLTHPIVLKESFSNPQLTFKNHILTFGGCRIALVDDNFWKHKTTTHPIHVDYLYLCKGFTGRLKELSQLFVSKLIILDSSLSDYRKASYVKACQEFGWSYISLSDKGSVRFLL